MTVISSSSTSPLVTDWSATDKILVKFMDYDPSSKYSEKNWKLVEVGISPNLSIWNLFNTLSGYIGQGLSKENYLIVRNYGNLGPYPDTSCWKIKKIILQKESDVYFICIWNNITLSSLPIDEDLKIQTQLFYPQDFIYKIYNDCCYNSAGRGDLDSVFKYIYGLIRDNHVNYRKRMLEGLSSTQISLQYPESDMRAIQNLPEINEILDNSALRVIPKPVQNIIRDYFENFSGCSLNEPTNFSKLLFKAIQLRFSYEGTRDEDEVSTYFKRDYLKIKSCINKMVEARESQHIKHLQELALEFVKSGLSLIKTNSLVQMENKENWISAENTENWTPEIETGNRKKTENTYAEELYSLLLNSNKTIFEALNALIKQFVILRQDNNDWRLNAIIGGKHELQKKRLFQLSPNISMRQLYLLMTEERKKLGVSNSDSYHFRILKRVPITRILNGVSTILMGDASPEISNHVKWEVCFPGARTIESEFSLNCHPFLKKAIFCYQDSDFSSWNDVLRHDSDDFSCETSEKFDFS